MVDRGQNAKQLYICGEPASGKSILRLLLDGHENLAVSYHMPHISSIYSNKKEFERAFQKEEVIPHEIRKVLPIWYYVSQDICEGRHSGTFVTQSRTERLSSQTFDFYKFDRMVFSDILESNISSIKELMDVVFDNLFRVEEKVEYPNEDIAYFVELGYTYIQDTKKFLQQTDQGKAIYIKRDPRGILGSFYNHNLQREIRNGRILQLKESQRKAGKLASEYKDRLLVIDFEDLIVNTKHVVEQVCNFIDINPRYINYRPTFYGSNIEFSKPIIGEINDDWDERLSTHQKIAATVQVGGLRTLPQALRSRRALKLLAISYTTWVLNNHAYPRLKSSLPFANR